MNYQQTYQYSLTDKEAFWRECSTLIDWHHPFERVLDDHRLPFVKWFVGGQTNLCYNAIDRHCEKRGDHLALTFISTETHCQVTYTFAQLRTKVMQMAAILQQLGVKQSDRVLIYMPMIPEAAFAMLACARLGAIHSVVFGGFASHALATRIDDARPTVLITADAGMRGGKVIPYQTLAREAIALSSYPPRHVLWVNRSLDHTFTPKGSRSQTALVEDHDYEALLAQVGTPEVPITWLESNEPSYILYTSGTTGKPKGIQRDVGGYAVALAASMKSIFCGEAGETMFTTSDIGWVVGHSYIIYAPLIAGMNTIMYEGLPIRPDAGIWWKIVEEHHVRVMFSAPTAIRVLKKHDTQLIKQYDLSRLKHLFLAGEPLDEPTAVWAEKTLGVPIIDNFWQTETGWPILALMRGIVSEEKTRPGSPGFPVVGYDVKLINNEGKIAKDNEKGIVCIQPPLPPGCLATVWGDDQRFIDTYFTHIDGIQYYSTFDYGVRDPDGYYFILGRTDDIINVAGHRIGTREIEEAISSHTAVAESAVVGIKDEVKGQMPVAFVVLKNPNQATETVEGKTMQEAIAETVNHYFGAMARPKRIYFVSMLPKTRSGKLLRRSLQALLEGRDMGDLSTLEDATTLQHIHDVLQQP